MIGPYLIKNPLLYVYLRCLDGFFVLLALFKKRKPIVKTPQKLLVVQWAHMGDVIIATSVLPLLKKAYPEAKIGMLIGSWSREIIHEHPMIDYIHIFDHPKINRSSQWLVIKLIRAFINGLKVIKELRSIEYDLSIDVYVYYPNSHFITWCSGVPQRLGYISGGGGKLLTHSLYWQDQKKHMSLYHLDLLRLLGIDSEQNFFLEGCLKPIPEKHFQKLKLLWNLPEQYVIFHPYSGDKNKNWPEDFWRKLLHAFNQAEYHVVFTGKGTVDKEGIDRISQKKQGSTNLANELSLVDLQSLFFGANMLVCVDTMISHLAAAWKLQTLVCVWSDCDFVHWRPASHCYMVLNYQKNWVQENSVP